MRRFPTLVLTQRSSAGRPSTNAASATRTPLSPPPLPRPPAAGLEGGHDRGPDQGGKQHRLGDRRRHVGHRTSTVGKFDDGRTSQ